MSSFCMNEWAVLLELCERVCGRVLPLFLAAGDLFGRFGTTCLSSWVVVVVVVEVVVHPYRVSCPLKLLRILRNYILPDVCMHGLLAVTLPRFF